ncbi:hypothetical protein B0A52_06466 [Exophiala mesophila]|uniref:Uncharacterized protein n=1 Tax=Exophiala mesophila TaxID=212818 RepID=A0A438N271_EXOME|nr:hypothetical protein B0A52_06466 [Exophiala mesophila]
MSDIEDYAYSPYDDLEDILYDADPAPELADDLAEHALHSPVYLDEVAGFELQDYFSDWEYYSDDYMDDDPTLESPLKDGKAPAKPSVTRGRKRKLGETLDTVSSTRQHDRELLLRPIKGTVWAEPSKPGPPPYKVGQGDPVAFLKNWKQVFSIQDDGWNKVASKTDNDESWAKDMSLADMGLGTLHREKSFDQGRLESEDEYDEEEGGEGEEDQGEEEDDEVENDDDETPKKGVDVPTEDEGVSSLPVRDDGARANGLEKDSESQKAEGDTTSEEGHHRKRRRYKAALPSPPNSTEHVTNGAEVASSSRRETQNSKKRKASPGALEGERPPSKSDANLQAKHIAANARRENEGTGSKQSRRTTRSASSNKK